MIERAIPKAAMTAAKLAVEREMRSRTYDRHAYDDEVFGEGVAGIAREALQAAAPHMSEAAHWSPADDSAGVIEVMTMVLVAHQRIDNRSCLCGWAELGKSHPAHQAAMLAAEGFDFGAA